jgi:TonB family protein
MRWKILCSMVLALATAVSPVAFAADNQPLELSPAEAVKYWTPKEGAFHPQVAEDPRKVAFAQEVTIEYTVTKRGRTKDVQILEVKPAEASGKWALSAVSAMRFEPTESNQARQPIRTQLLSRWGSNAAVEQP